MGKISTGCDIVFMVGGDKKNLIRMGSNLSSDLTSYEKIAIALLRDLSVKSSLKDKLKYESGTRKVTKEDIEEMGTIVHNSTVQSLASKYTYLNWDNVNLSTKILATDKFSYFGEIMNNLIVKYSKGGIVDKIFIINPKNPDQVKQLNSYLIAQSKLENYSNDVKELIESSDLNLIVELFKDSLERADIKDFNLIPRNAKELIQYFMDYKDKFQSLTYKVNDQIKSVLSELGRVLRALEGKKEKSTTYLDVFANEIVSRSDYDKVRNLNKIPTYSFIEALLVKLEDLQSLYKTIGRYFI